MVVHQLGRMTGMPRRTRPRPPLAPELEVAAAAFASREDLAILAFLGSVEWAAAPQICEALGMALNTAHRHLGLLEALRLIQADTKEDTPVGSRRGRTVRYSLDRAATAAALDDMRAALLGSRPTRPASRVRPHGRPVPHMPPT